VVIVSGLILLFLVTLICYEFVDYQKNIKLNVDNVMYQYSQKAAKDLEAINSEMYDIYSYDDNFEYLQYSEGVDSMQAAYGLSERLKTRLTMQERSSGYIFFYDDFGHKNYYFRQEISEVDDLEELKEIAYAVATADYTNKAWFYNDVNGSTYGVCVYRSGNIALCEYYRLSDLKEDMINEIGIDGVQIFFQQNDKILGEEGVSSDFSEVDTKTDSLNGYYIFHKSVPNSGVVIYAAMPINFFTLVNVQLMVLVGFTLLVIVLAIIAYKNLERQLLMPLTQLIGEMKRIGAGDLSNKILSKSRFSEIQTVIDTTDKMIDEIQKQKMVAYENELDAQRAHLQYLSLQLKPHFYLNGLKTLNVMAMNKDTRKIQDVIMHLSTHLRYLLTLEKQLVPLQSEIDYVKNYVALQQEMTDRVINIQWQVKVERSDWLVPNLCIQTFVENSFKYAKLGNNSNELIIYISINELDADEEQILDLYIRDNGEGYPTQVLDIINDEPKEGLENVGINNLKRRCKLLYGKSFECIFANDNGAVSNLFLPYLEQGVENNEFVNC